MSNPIRISETRAIGYEEVYRDYSYDEILQLFPDGDGSIVNPLVRRCQQYEAEIERLKQHIRCDEDDALSIESAFTILTDKNNRLQQIIQQGSCYNCHYFSLGCGSANKDGVCKNPGTRETTRYGVLPGIWSHVKKDDVCLQWKQQISASEVNTATK